MDLTKHPELRRVYMVVDRDGNTMALAGDEVARAQECANQNMRVLQYGYFGLLKSNREPT